MCRIILALLISLVATEAHAQGGIPNFPQTIPGNTVVGRVGNTPGPTQAITFTNLATLLGVTGGGGFLTVASGGTGTGSLTGLALGAGTSPFVAYGGTACTNQFILSLNNNGVATCGTVLLGLTQLGITGVIKPSADSTTAIQVTKADGATVIVDVDSTNRRVGINKTPGAFDLDVNGAANVGGALTFAKTTITGLTANNSPNTSNDYLLYFSAADDTIRKCTVGACGSAGVSGVSALNGLTGGLSIATSGGVNVTAAATTVTLQAGNIVPQGRLTLTSATPVLTADATAQTTIYYTAYDGRHVPVYNGTTMTVQGICADNTAGTCELSIAMAGNAAWALGSVYDIFVGVDSSTVRLCTGPAWTSTTARGTGAGTTELQRINGIWTNKVSATCRYAAASTFTCGVNQCTYVGSVYAVTNGTTSMTFKPAAAAGGSANALALYNAYNRVRIIARTTDSTATWTYATNTWRAANASASNRISFLDGLQQSTISARYANQVLTSAGIYGQVGVNLDSTSATPGGFQGIAASPSGSTYNNAVGFDNIAPQLGLHFVQAVELANGATVTFNGGAGINALQVELEM